MIQTCTYLYLSNSSTYHKGNGAETTEQKIVEEFHVTQQNKILGLGMYTTRFISCMKTLPMDLFVFHLCGGSLQVGLSCSFSLISTGLYTVRD